MFYPKFIEKVRKITCESKKNKNIWIGIYEITQLLIICSKSTIETLEKVAKYVQS